jgi:hypothetical protein
MFILWLSAAFIKNQIHHIRESDARMCAESTLVANELKRLVPTINFMMGMYIRILLRLAHIGIDMICW